MGKTFDVICMGEICQDMLMSGISLDELVRPGGTTIADEYISALGGDAANEASVLSRLGNRVAFLGRTGTDSQGDFLVDSLKRAGVDTSLVIRKEGCHNIISVCVTKTDHSHSFLVVKGTDALLTFSDVDLSAFAKTRALCMAVFMIWATLSLMVLTRWSWQPSRAAHWFSRI